MLVRSPLQCKPGSRCLPGRKEDGGQLGEQRTQVSVGGGETWARPDSQGQHVPQSRTATSWALLSGLCWLPFSVFSPVSYIISFFSYGFSWPLLCFLPGSVASLWFLPPSCCAWRQPKGLGQEPCWGACVCALTGGKHQHVNI